MHIALLSMQQAQLKCDCAALPILVNAIVNQHACCHSWSAWQNIGEIFIVQHHAERITFSSWCVHGFANYLHFEWQSKTLPLLDRNNIANLNLATLFIQCATFD